MAKKRSKQTPAADNVKTTALSIKQALAWHYLEQSMEARQILYGGAAGGGKSWFGCMWQTYRRIKYPGTRGFIGRNVREVLKVTTLNTFLEFWANYGVFNPFGVKMIYNKNESIAYFSNGSEILFRELRPRPDDPDFARLGSMEITDAFVDEVTDCTQRAIEVLFVRIRYKLHMLEAPVPKILLASNPSNNWVKHKFVLSPKNTPIVLPPDLRFVQATLDDNPDEFFKTVYGGNLKSLNSYDYRRLRLGDWSAIERTGYEFYHSFDYNQHVRTGVQVNPGLPLHISFDQNVVPYITATCWQMWWEDDTLVVVQVAELCLEHPKNTTRDLCLALLGQFAELPYFFIYGDASGNKRDTRSKETDYSIIQTMLAPKMVNGSMRVLKQNPPVGLRGEFVNEVLAGKYKIGLFLADNCSNTITDLQELKQDVNGGKLKQMAVNPKTGQAYQRLGHTSDSMDYFLTVSLRRWWDIFKAKRIIRT